MLSKRITAKSRDAKPANQASDNTVTVISVLKPVMLLNIVFVGLLPGFPTAAAGIFELDYINS